MSKKHISQNGGDRKLFDEGDTIDVVSLLGALRRHKWLILLVTLLGTTAAALYGKSRVPAYTAAASILIDPSLNPVADLQQAGGLTTDQAAITTQIRILQSRTYQARVMEDMGLFDDPEFNPYVQGEPQPGPLDVLKEPIERLTDLLPDKWLVATGLADENAAVPALDPTNDALTAHLAREAAISSFADRLQLFNDGISHVIQIAFSSPDPEKAARVANRTAEIYVDEQVQLKQLTGDRTSTYLQARIEELRNEVRGAEEAVANFRGQNSLTTADGATLSDQGVTELNGQLINARADLAEREARLSEVRQLRAQGLGVEALSQMGAAPVAMTLRQQEADLLRREAELSTLYGERHPEMQQIKREKEELQGTIQAEINRLVRGLESDVQVTNSRINTVESQLATLKEQSGRDRTSGVQLAELERKAESARQIYEEFYRSYLENRETTENAQPDARIVAQAAAPLVPSTPGAKIFTAAGFVFSLVLGSFVAIVMDRMDRGLRSGKDVERLLGVPMLGMVQKLDKLKKNQKPYQYLMDKPLSAYTEAIRGLYMALKLGKVDQPAKVVLVTSSLPQEGKTTLAVSLATLAARSDKRVLLMDLDLRHPSVHRELGWQVSGGLVEYMTNERSLEEVIHHDLETGLHFLPIKGQTTNPTDLLDSQRLKLLLKSLRDSYDYVVLDTAPLASVTDTRVAAGLADQVLFCVRWGETVVSAAEDSVQALRDVGVEPVGAVLTQVDMKKHAQYGYADVGQYYTQSQKYYVN